MKNFIVSKVNALQNLTPNAKYTWRGSEYSGLEWHDDEDQTKPTDSEIKSEIERLDLEYDTQEYARDRATSYPSVGDQLDMMMKDMKNGTTTHQTACEAVKAQFPKPE
jgi:hypothetical protein